MDHSSGRKASDYELKDRRSDSAGTRILLQYLVQTGYESRPVSYQMEKPPACEDEHCFSSITGIQEFVEIYPRSRTDLHCVVRKLTTLLLASSFASCYHKSKKSFGAKWGEWGGFSISVIDFWARYSLTARAL